MRSTVSNSLLAVHLRVDDLRTSRHRNARDQRGLAIWISGKCHRREHRVEVFVGVRQFFNVGLLHNCGEPSPPQVLATRSKLGIRRSLGGLIGRCIESETSERSPAGSVLQGGRRLLERFSRPGDGEHVSGEQLLVAGG